ncbi:hypothetical protein PIB30_053896 [Stylosanthes scabra]|uniref:CCHC-type domain-containing protein n=1 Tax=Stylosanthes scabra TaxID=79078 RepID=A0ABU6WKA1_9FABA|nr:hypothetical protein [Stylosanthes scabra]
MPPPYRRPSHRPNKKRRRGYGEDENRRNQHHLSRRGQIQRCSNCGAAGHKKRGCPRPIDNAHSSAPPKPTNQNSNGVRGKGKKQAQSNNRLPKLPTRGGKNAADQQPPNNPRGVKRKATSSQPNPSTTPKKASTAPNKRPAAPKKPNPKGPTQPIKGNAAPKNPTRKACSQPNPTSCGGSQRMENISSTHPGSSKPSSLQQGRRANFTMRHSGAPHVSPQKLRQMAKLPPRKWGHL